jgi:hypothetical protein
MIDADTADTGTSRYASRKFLLTVASLIVATMLLLYGKIDATARSHTVTWCMGLYMAGNAATWATDALRTP